MQLDMDEHQFSISNIQKLCSYARQIEQMGIDGTLNYANFADIASNLVSISDTAMVQLTTMISNEPTASRPPLVSPIPMTQNISQDLSTEQCRSPSGRNYSRKGKCVRFEIQKPRDDKSEGPVEDGYVWRKYGRKRILGSPYPRDYYTCKEQNCPAKKRVQKTEREDYAVEYIDKHCNHPMQANSNSFELSRQIPPPVSDSSILRFSIQTADQHSNLQELGSSMDFDPAFYAATPDLDLHHEWLALDRNSAAEMHLDMQFHSFEAYGPTSPSIFDI